MTELQRIADKDANAHLLLAVAVTVLAAIALIAFILFVWGLVKAVLDDRKWRREAAGLPTLEPIPEPEIGAQEFADRLLRAAERQAFPQRQLTLGAEK